MGTPGSSYASCTRYAALSPRRSPATAYVHTVTPKSPCCCSACRPQSSLASESHPRARLAMFPRGYSSRHDGGCDHDPAALICDPDLHSDLGSHVWCRLQGLQTPRTRRDTPAGSRGRGSARTFHPYHATAAIKRAPFEVAPLSVENNIFECSMGCLDEAMTATLTVRKPSEVAESYPISQLRKVLS